MTKKPNWTKATPETISKIEFIYGMLTSTAESPAEAATIISGVLVHLWLAGKSETGNIDHMLEGLCTCIKLNVEHSESRLQ